MSQKSFWSCAEPLVISVNCCRWCLLPQQPEMIVDCVFVCCGTPLFWLCVCCCCYSEVNHIRFKVEIATKRRVKLLLKRTHRPSCFWLSIVDARLSVQMNPVLFPAQPFASSCVPIPSDNQWKDNLKRPKGHVKDQINEDNDDRDVKVWKSSNNRKVFSSRGDKGNAQMIRRTRPANPGPAILPFSHPAKTIE